MNKGRRYLLLILLGVAIALLGLGGLTIPLATPALQPGQEPPNVIVTLIPFIFFLFGILVTFIAFVILLCTLFNNNVREELYRPVEILLIVGIILGVLGMIQPLRIELYNLGFLLLFACTIGYIIWSHIVPRGGRSLEEVGTVSASEAEQAEAHT
jgi:hypothetical protein